MSTVSCRDFQDRFDSSGDSPRNDSPPDLTVHAHLRDCPSCRSFVEDLGKIRAAATQLAGSDPEPPARIWFSLRAELEKEGLIRDTPSKSPSKSWLGELLGGRFSVLPRPVLAGGYLAALLAIAFGLSGPINSRINRQRWVDGNQSSMEAKSERW